MEVDYMKKTHTKQELESMTVIYDYLQPTIAAAAKRSGLTLKPILSEVRDFADRNHAVLQTNIIGKQLLFRKNTEDAILDAIGINQREFKVVLDNAPYFEQFGNFKLKDQLLFALPLIMLSIELHKNKKDDMAMFLFNTVFYKPYATIVYKYFGKFPVNDDQMLYTVENLTGRYDIKRYGTLQAVIEKKAETYFKNFIDDYEGKEISDYDLHQTLFNSIYSGLNKFVQEIMSAYQDNKGKYLPFENISDIDNADEYSDKEIGEIEIKSDAAAKSLMYRKAIDKINRSPVDIKLLEIAAKFSFADYGSRKMSENHIDSLNVVISEAVKNKPEKVNELVENILSSFISEKDARGVKNSVSSISNVSFLQQSLHNIVIVSNTVNRATLRVKALLEEILTMASAEYVTAGKTKKQKMKKAVLMYFLLVIQKG
jgi:hypothetical protein